MWTASRSPWNSSPKSKSLTLVAGGQPAGSRSTQDVLAWLSGGDNDFAGVPIQNRGRRTPIFRRFRMVPGFRNGCLGGRDPYCKCRFPQYRLILSFQYKKIKNSPQYMHAMHTILLIMTLNPVINESKPINQNQY